MAVEFGRQTAGTSPTGAAGMSAGVLSIDDAASGLAVRSLSVKRLIARGILPATAVGNGTFRVLADDLNAYVKRGAPDLALPPMTGAWFDVSETFPAGRFRSQIMNAVESKWPNAATVQSWYDKDPQGTYNLPIKAADVVSLINEPVPKSILPNQLPSRFASMGQLFMAKAWRDAVAFKMGNGDQAGTLYSSPSEYRSLLDWGWENILQQTISGTKTFTTKPKSGPNEARTVSVRMALPLSGLVPYVDKKQLELLTF